MLYKTVFTSLVSLALIHGAHALPQVTTALPFNVVNAQDPSASIGIVSGEIVGTGSAGTTYVLSAETATFTLVENASQLVAIESASKPGTEAIASITCGLSAGLAACTGVNVFVESSTTATVTETTSGTVALVTAVISTGSASSNSSSSASSSASGASATQSLSGTGKHIGSGFTAAVASLVFGAVILAY